MINYDDMETVYKILQAMDIPFFYDYWETAQKSGSDTFSSYIRMANSKINEFKKATWKDSKFKKQNFDEMEYEDDDEKDLIDFKVTSEMIQRWGSKHDKDAYIKLEQFYTQMKIANRIETPQDENYLKKLAMISVKMDKELEDGNYDEVKKLGDLFSKYMGDSKFRAMDKTDADNTGGIRRFCDIYVEVEKDDFIPPWEYYRKINGAKQDIVDKSIMFILNFMLKFNRADKLSQPPFGTPKIEDYEIDINANNSLEIKELEVDENE
jgi:hypothetical protein